MSHRQEENTQTDLKEIGGETWIGFIWLRQGSVLGSCEHGNEHPSFIKCWELLASQEGLRSMETVT